MRCGIVYPLYYIIIILIGLFLILKLFGFFTGTENLTLLRTSEFDYYHRMIANPYRYNWTLLEQNFCTRYHPETRYLIIMHTASENFDRRRVYRLMYADEYFQQFGVRLLFTVGHSTNRLVNDLVQKESAIHHDLIQQNFIDSYQNLTWKALMSLRFVKEYCNETRYVISTDDDVIINLWEVIKILQMYPNIPEEKDECNQTIFCNIIRHQKVIRNPFHKWYQSKAEFPDDYYKDYCAALAIIIPGPLINKLFEAAKNETFHKFDDYFLTGIVARKVGVKFKDFSKKAFNHIHKSDRKAFLSRRIYFQATETITQTEEMWTVLKQLHKRRSLLNKEKHYWH
uniref:Hexosyltransferase n=1 Tax=Syphacia muris TaxID=451379 RepID=A0A0N5AMI3_9BILA